MVEISPYTYKMLPAVQYLHETQGHSDASIVGECLPKIGFVATDSDDIVAIGFLRIVEGGFAQIDTLVSNGTLSPWTRHKGISGVVDALINEAKRLKLKGIMALTLDKSILMRAEAIGFKVIPQTVIGLSFEETIR